MKGKLLIVDDEFLIRKGLAKMIEECPVQWQIAGEAEDGESALERITDDRVCPDLVITDVRMPVMDGLELCSRIARLDKPIDVIVLTAHKDFEFAQTALRYGAIDFLLKPISMEELTRSLEKAYRSFAERQRERARHLMEHQRLQEHGIRSWLLGLPMDAQAESAVREGYRGMELAVLAIETYTPAYKEYKREDASLLQFAVHNVMAELFGLCGMKGHLIKVKHDVFALVASPAPALDEFVTQAKEKARELLGLTLTSVRFGIDAMQTAYGKLHVYGSAGRQEGEGAQLQQHDNAARSKSIQTELMSYILQGKTELLREYLDRFAANVRQLESNDAKIEGLGLAMALAEIGKREFAGADRAEGEGGIAKWISELQPLTRPEEVAAWSAGPIGEFMWQLNSWLSSKNVNLLDKAIRYIENHYCGSCTVHDTAQHVHLSVSYFSNLFKKETGESYTNYLARYRLGKAKILLCNTNMKIAEIAESVGYDDPNYFTTVFRQWFQASPSEYRKQHQA